MITIKQFKLWFFTLLTIFLIDFAKSETRDEVRKIEIQEKLDKSTHSSTQEEAEEEKTASTLFSRGKAVGFYSFGQETFKSYRISDILVASLLPASNSDNIIILRFLCSKPEDIFPLTLTQKTIKWRIDDGDLRESLTDREGYARLRFTSKNDVILRRLEVEIGSYKKKVDLPAGPFDIFLNEEFCEK